MEPTIYKPSIYKGSGIYKTGAEGGGGGGGIACIRCIKGYEGYYIEIPINCTNRSKFEVGFNLCENWAKDGLGIFAGLGTTYYPPVFLSDASINSTNYSVSCSWFDINSLVNVTNKIYPNSFNFYHAEITTTDTNTIFKLTDLNGNVIQNSVGHLVRSNDISKISLFTRNGTKGNIPGFEIYYFKVGDILDLVPDEQNGVPGFTDKISGNFYPPNDSTAFLAVKQRTPL